MDIDTTARETPPASGPGGADEQATLSDPDIALAARIAVSMRGPLLGRRETDHFSRDPIPRFNPFFHQI